MILVYFAQHGAPGCERRWVRTVGEAVHHRSGAIGNRIHHFCVCDHSADGSVPAGEPLRGSDDVRSPLTFRPMLVSEVAAGAAEAGHYFVADQQDLVAARDPGDVAQISSRRSDRTECRSTRGFEDERCRLALTGQNGIVELLSEPVTAFCAT